MQMLNVKIQVIVSASFIILVCLESVSIYEEMLALREGTPSIYEIERSIQFQSYNPVGESDSHWA